MIAETNNQLINEPYVNMKVFDLCLTKIILVIHTLEATIMPRKVKTPFSQI